jgi:hypothetical protein
MFWRQVDPLLFVLALVLSAALPTILAGRLSARGSDQFVHLYFIKALRRDGHRLFTMLPRVLNPTPTAYPLFLHWALSFMPPKRIDRLKGGLNVAASALQATILYLALKYTVSVPFLPEHAGGVTLAVAASPQLFHIYNARVTGISARPIGWLLFFVHWLAIYHVQRGLHPAAWGLTGLLAGYGICGTSIFALQGLILFAVVYGLVFWSGLPPLAAAASLGLFVALHPRFGRAYLIQYLRYSKIYATILAPANLLRRRHGVWRDLVQDIWIRFARSRREGLQYAYGNPVVVAVALNPLVFLSAYYVSAAPAAPFLGFCARIGVVALIVAFLTTFRATRFLGEPERYLELAIPFTGTLGVWAVMTSSNARLPWAVFGYFALMNVGQMAVAFALARRAPKAERLQIVAELPRIAEAINAQFAPDQVRFASNEEDVTKYMLLEDWQFVWYWPSTDRYGDMTYQEAFSLFPFVRKESFERLIAMYEVNVCLLDKSNFGSVFDAPGPFRSMPVLDTPRYVVCRIERVMAATPSCETVHAAA